MRKSCFLLAAALTLAMVDAASAQYPPTLGGTWSPPVTTAPIYTVPGYTAPNYAVPTAPNYTTPGASTPGYQWREQRANEDWRNNTWREQRYNEDWRNNNWRQQRANEDWQQREDYSKKTMPNNAVDQGYVATGQPPKPAIETEKNPLLKEDAIGTKPSPVIKPEDCGVSVSRLATACLNYAKDKTKPNVITDRTKTNGTDKAYDRR